jgi:hypothetical protein
MNNYRMVNTRKDVIAFGVSMFANCLAGCTLDPKRDPAEPFDDPLEHLDPVALTMAIDNQRKLETVGLHLVGRVWFGADAYGEIYEAPESSLADSADRIYVHQDPQILTFVVNSSSELATRVDLRPQAGETLSAYVERTNRGQIQARFNPGSRNLDESGTDVLLFRPAVISQDRYLSSTKQALANEFCPKSAFDEQCRHYYGYAGDVAVNTWNVFDRRTASFSGTGTSAYGVACADRFDTTLSISRGASAAITLDISQGFFAWAAAWEGWTQREYCASYVIICTDYRWRFHFGRVSYSVNITPKIPSSMLANSHFCGSIRNKANYTQEHECVMSRSCPSPPSLVRQ